MHSNVGTKIDIQPFKRQAIAHTAWFCSTLNLLVVFWMKSLSQESHEGYLYHVCTYFILLQNSIIKMLQNNIINTIINSTKQYY